MAREPYVFYCEGGCKAYVLVKLDIDLEGEHVIICPSCKHHHYRTIKKGEITESRHDKGEQVDTIEPMPSAVFKTRDDALEALALGKNPRDSFLNDLWRRKANNEGWME